MAFSLSPSQTKNGGCQGAARLLGWALMDTLLCSSSAAEHLVVLPGVSALGEAGLAAN